VLNFKYQPSQRLKYPWLSRGHSLYAYFGGRTMSNSDIGGVTKHSYSYMDGGQ